jgi:hypothetical protein
MGAITGTADDLRTGHYPNQPALEPGLVSGPTFGRLWKTKLPMAVEEQVFAQPMFLDGKVLIATESNNLYLLDGETGAILGTRNLGQPWQAVHVNCQDLRPNIGVTGTPVIDAATRTAYLLSKTYRDGTPSAAMNNAIWLAHAIDFDTLAERPGFPIEIKGNAQNQAGITFEPFWELQRPALLLMNGVVYAGFGGHCDAGDYRGWVAGFSTGGQLKSMFVTEPSKKGGGGIWQAGGGLVSDGKDRIFALTSNAADDTPEEPEATPTARLGQSALRLEVQADGTLNATDFFSPYNRSTLDLADTDFGSGAPVALPEPYFGTPAHPRLMITGGKAGVLYVLDRDALGGFRQGPGGADQVLSQVSLPAGMWSRPGVWPGDGGYIYIIASVQPLLAYKYGVGGDGKPVLSEAGRGEAMFGYSSGSPIITSDGLKSGSALVWVNYASGTYGEGLLRAYDAVPDSTGKLRLRYEDDYGAHAKFSVPGVGNARIYVGTADGHVLAYGAPVNKPLSATSVQWGAVVVGETVTKTATIVANQPLTITNLTVGNPVFTLGAATPPLPATLTQGQSITVPVSFAPAASDLYAASIDVTSSAGPGSVSLVGRGQSLAPKLVASAKTLSFGGLARGRTSTINIVLSNSGAQPVVWGAFTPPAAPFTVTNLPTAGGSLAPDAQISLSVTFAPTVEGQYSGQFTIASTGGDLTIALSGSAGAPPTLVITPAGLSFGAQPQGSTSELSFSVSNGGGANLTITKSKPPGLGVFKALTPLDEGVVIQPGQMLTLTIAFTPTTLGSFADQWTLTGDDASGVHMVAFSGSSTLVDDAGAGDAALDAGPATDGPVALDLGVGGHDATGDGPSNGDAGTDTGSSVHSTSVDDGCSCRLGGRAAPLPPLPAVLLLGLLAVGWARKRG